LANTSRLPVREPGGAAPVEALSPLMRRRPGPVGVHHEVGAALAGPTAPEGDLPPVAGDARARLLEDVAVHRVGGASVPAHQVDPLAADEEDRATIGREGGVILESCSRVADYPLARSVSAHEEQHRALRNRVRVHATALRRDEPLEDDRLPVRRERARVIVDEMLDAWLLFKTLAPEAEGTATARRTLAARTRDSCAFTR
jgi:hypothetical protein